MKSKIIVGLILVVCLSAALYSMKGMLTPYVPFSEAMKAGAFVQVMGLLDKSARVEQSDGFYTFRIKDADGALMTVRGGGARPQNFEHADSVVALGRYNEQSRTFEADRVLVKCPSKYTRGNNH